ncbi:LacI family DNA-binding transcriptional regulator [Donghicola mangrovi]|uniref:Substrate-binding domain-containing protein n=1 Tax=Donghicola mangrovi TaxID=2729614 RepID=A0A850Q4T7_9RHOB|nr:LacI family DNA-binding transcriptional regulator [Donghicola mangrovi]NVO24727.1 substrate-binding domain-containing protein [Donghicola mangrovi]
MTDAQERNRRVTAADVARAAGVSRSAVSRAFTPEAYLDADKRRAILQVADELGYRPNAIGAALQGASSNLVAIVVGDTPSPFDKEVATALAAGLNAAGKYPIMIGGSQAVSRAAVSDVLRYPLDAMILRTGSLSPDFADACGKLGIPLISSGRIMDRPLVDNVCVQNEAGMEMITDLLLSRGRKAFGFIGGPSGFGSAGRRRAGMMQSLAKAGLDLTAEVTGDYTVESGFRAVEALLSQAPVDAILCANDAMAIGAISGLRQRGLRVPEDVAVTGFDDVEMAGWPEYRLTTVRNPINDMVAAIVDLLEARINAPRKAGETRWLTPEVILRETH